MDFQEALATVEYVFTPEGPSVLSWRDARLLPAYVAVVSATVLISSTILRHLSPCLFKNSHDTHQRNAAHKGVRAHVDSLGGPIIFVLKLVRAVCMFVLLVLYIYDLVRDVGIRTHSAPIDGAAALELTLFLTYLYASGLAVLNIATSAPLSNIAAPHLVLILLASCTVYGFRDIWPLMTYTLQPLDIEEGVLMWIKIALLAVAGIIIPLLVPRQYIPLDPKKPSEKPNPEQTCSILSLLTYSFLDEPVYAAYSSRKISDKTLPVVADYDRTAHLVERSFKHLDVFSGAPRQHMFFALMRVFRWEYAILACMMGLRALTQLFAPIGINRLLAYLETGGKDAIIRPWVWCLLIFLGPFSTSVVAQFYAFIATATLVRAEAIITQLIFEHALRLRVKSDVADEAVDVGSATATLSGSLSEGGDGNQSNVEAKKDKRKDTNFVGKLNNLVTTDLQNIVSGRDFMLVVVHTPVMVAASLYTLYLLLGWSTFVGMAIVIACLPVPGYLAKMLQSVQKTLMKKTDARVQTATEMMGVLRMIKMFGWEGKVAQRLDARRHEELRLIRLSELISLGTDSVTLFIPALQMVATYGTFTLVMGGSLTPSIVFSSMSIFMLLRNLMSMLFYFASPLIKAKVSLDRVTEFLRETELLDQYADIRTDEANPNMLSARPSDDSTIGMRNASFTWSAESPPTYAVSEGSQRAFSLRIPGELSFQRGKINLIVGPTGSGKTSLLMALLGEMHFVPLVAGAWVNLPRHGGAAYAAQESWVQNETIRDNILFGAPYDEVRYKKVIHQCGLKRDLSLFEAGDKTEVGEKGLTLSGGQKARVTLARAIYSSADILLLDDVLAALDVHTAKWIVDKCFKGDLVRGRTVLLVTHNIALTGPVADYVVALGSDGSIAARGSYYEVLAKDKELAQDAGQDIELQQAHIEEETIAELEDLNEPVIKADGKLIVEEEVAEGHVSLHALQLFWTALGGRHPVPFWTTFLVGVFACHIFGSAQSYWLGKWADAYLYPGPVDVVYYMAMFVLIVFATTVAFAIFTGTYVFGVLRAAKKIHALLIDSILGTTLNWLDRTPVSRVITRCTKDIKSIDGQFAHRFRWLVSISAQLITQLGAIALVTPAVILPGTAIFFIGAWIGSIYMKAQLPVKREMSNRKAPVLGHFGSAIAGLTSIRAYGAQDAFRRESHERIQAYTRPSRTFDNLNRWIGMRSDTLAALFPSILGAYMLYGPGSSTIGASDTGFSLAMASNFSSMILLWVRFYNDFEVEGNSLERIQAYMEIEQEPKPVKEKTPPAAWPTSGDLRVVGLSARYSPDGPKVLHDLSFSVKSGERVGIVGRTGSGKSSLTLSLLRCIVTEGDVYYDGINTADLNLDVLRTNVTIIPQVPELLSGTLRENLDPFNEHDDAVLNSALRASGLLSLQSETDEGRITLDSQISSGGGNLSVGQRQILALARALVRGSKLLILDEATSSIDYETDTIIQSSLRNELGGDVTLLTVAHRLQTIMDADKIMVLDAGRIVEFDSPKVLLKQDGGFLKSLVDESGDKDTLYAMAGSAASY